MSKNTAGKLQRNLLLRMLVPVFIKSTVQLSFLSALFFFCWEEVVNTLTVSGSTVAIPGLRKNLYRQKFCVYSEWSLVQTCCFIQIIGSSSTRSLCQNLSHLLKPELWKCFFCKLNQSLYCFPLE